MAKEWDGIDRRAKPKTKDTLYKFALGANILAWLIFVSAMVVFHFARPEQETGFHRFKGIEVRTEWQLDYIPSLLILLACCTILSIVDIILRRRRSRRSHDGTAYNVIALCLAAGGGLAWVYHLYSQLNAA